MENTHAEKDTNMWPKADVSLKMGLEMTQCNSGWSSWPEKKKTKNQKIRYNSLESTDIDDNRHEGTFSINITPVQVDSFPHPPINTCLSADLEITQHDTEVILSQDMDKGMEQNKRHNALESNDINQDHKEGGNRPSHSLTNTEYVERGDDNHVSENAEKLNCFPKCVDDSSIKKHDDHVHVDIISLDVSNIQTYQVNKQNIRRRKRRKFSDTMEGSLGFIEDGAGSSVLVVQDSSVRDTSVNHSNEAPASGYSEKMLGDVVAGYGSSLLVVGDISVGKASVECPGGEIVSGEREKKIKIENLKEIINEHSVVKGVSWADPPGKKLERGNSDKLNVFHNTVQDIHSSKRRFDKSTIFYKEGKASDDASGSDPSVEKLESDNLEIHPKVKDAISSSSQLGVWNDEVSLTVIRKDGPQQMLQPSLGAATGNFRKKLLVLDVNGLLADIVSYVSPGYRPDAVISKKAVFKRPFCDDFLQFCFERFHVGVWSSRTKRNVESVLDFLMGKSKCNLLFCWDQSQCTDTGFNTVENREKPLLLKELKKLWEKHEPDLPWDRGVYNESNTLLLDDSPYKALRNPMHTAIFPHPYRYKEFRDNSLGPSGDLRIYLVGLASADNVQKYVEQNPFGQRPITNKNLSWPFYLKVIGSTTSTQQEEVANNSSACYRNNFQT